MMDQIGGAALIVGSLGIPLVGCVLAVLTKQMEWLWLLAPLIIYMEGGIALGIVAILAVCFAIAFT
mgnify:CR=1 FL=1